MYLNISVPESRSMSDQILERAYQKALKENEGLAYKMYPERAFELEQPWQYETAKGRDAAETLVWLVNKYVAQVRESVAADPELTELGYELDLQALEAAAKYDILASWKYGDDAEEFFDALAVRAWAQFEMLKKAALPPEQKRAPEEGSSDKSNKRAKVAARVEISD